MSKETREIGPEERPKPMNKRKIHCHVYAHGFIAKLFLKEFGSNRVSYRFNTTAKRTLLFLMPIGIFNRTCFMTVLHRCASHKVRLLVIQGFGSVFLKNRRGTKSIG